jgi:hypothetical protein
VYGEKVEWVDGKVAIYYYPGEFHTELLVDGTLYNPVGGFHGKHASEAAAKRAAESGKTGYFAFHIRVTNEELAKIKKFVQENQDVAFQTCTSGACNAINKNTGLTIPFLISKLPAYSAFYLGIKRVMGAGFGRVRSIRYVGMKRDISMALLGITLESIAPGATVICAVAITVDMIDRHGKKTEEKTYVVPIVEQKPKP